MHNRERKVGQGVFSMALTNFDSWLRSPRTILMVLFIAAICYLQMCGYKMTLERTGYTMHLGETLFYEFNFGCNMPMTTVLFLIMVSELPRQIAFQQYSLIRSSRGKWMIAQIVYCLMMVVAMMLMLFVFLLVMALPLVTPGGGWSDAERIAAKIIEPEDALIEKYIMERFSPATATILAMVPIFLFWFTMVSTILFFGVWKPPVLGVLVYAFIMVAHVTIYFEYFPFPISMPMHFATLQNLTNGYEGQEIGEIVNAFKGYGVILVSLISAILISAKRVELTFDNENKV